MRSDEASAAPVGDGPAPFAPPPRPTQPIHEQIEDLKNLVLVRKTAESADLVSLLTSKRRMAANNFILGLFRGVGFFLGLSIVGSVALGILAWGFGLIKAFSGVEIDRILDQMARRGETLVIPVNGSGIQPSDLEEAIRLVLQKEHLLPAEKEAAPPETAPEEEASGEAGEEK